METKWRMERRFFVGSAPPWSPTAPNQPPLPGTHSTCISTWHASQSPRLNRAFLALGQRSRRHPSFNGQLHARRATPGYSFISASDHARPHTQRTFTPAELNLYHFSSKSLTQWTCTPVKLNLDHFLKSPCTPPPTTNPTKHPSSSTT